MIGKAHHQTPRCASPRLTLRAPHPDQPGQDHGRARLPFQAGPGEARPVLPSAKYETTFLLSIAVGVRDGVVTFACFRLPSSSQRPDPELARAAVEPLKWNILVPDDRMQVIVEEGWVSLKGEVENHLTVDPNVYTPVSDLPATKKIRSPNRAPDVLR